MPVPAQLIDLNNRFERHLDAYRSGQYNGTQAHREFIDPLLILLGWDVANSAGYAEQYKQVVLRCQFTRQTDAGDEKCLKQ